MTNDTDKPIVQKVDFCGCTNEQLERGETCGLPVCPNFRGQHPRLDSNGEANAATVTEEGRWDDRALELLDAHRDFDRSAFAWVGSEYLGGGIFCVSVYCGTEARSPYLWITESEDDAARFLACVYFATSDGEEESERPLLEIECDADELAAECARMLTSAKAAAAVDAWEIEVPADATRSRRCFDASPHKAGQYLSSVIGDHTARVLVCRRGSETFEPPTADELAPVYVAAGFTEPQGRAIEESVANIAASDEVDLRGMRRLKDGDEFGGFPKGAAIVEFTYRYRDDDRPERPGREVTVFAVDGEVITSQDFG
jgi:hypothetical protein